MDDEIFEEDSKAILNTSKNIVKKAGKAYNNGLNKRADFVATKIVKKPDDPSLNEQYQKKINNIKLQYKVGEVALTGLVAIGPVDWLLKALLVSGLKHSKDPADKAMLSKITAIKDKKSKFELAVKKGDKAESKNAFKVLHSVSTAAAKAYDVLHKKKSVTESSNYEVNENYLYAELFDDYGEFKESSYDRIVHFMESADFTNEHDVQISEKLIEILCEL